MTAQHKRPYHFHMEFLTWPSKLSLTYLIWWLRTLQPPIPPPKAMAQALSREARLTQSQAQATPTFTRNRMGIRAGRQRYGPGAAIRVPSKQPHSGSARHLRHGLQRNKKRPATSFTAASASRPMRALGATTAIFPADDPGSARPRRHPRPHGWPWGAISGQQGGIVAARPDRTIETRTKGRGIRKICAPYMAFKWRFDLPPAGARGGRAAPLPILPLPCRARGGSRRAGCGAVENDVAGRNKSPPYCTAGAVHLGPSHMAGSLAGRSSSGAV